MKVLTTRELEVADLIHQGLIEKEIAEKLFLSQGTVHTYKKRLFQKLHARNIADITRIYILDIKHPGMVVAMFVALILQAFTMIQLDFDMLRPVRSRIAAARQAAAARVRTGRTFKLELE